MWKLAHVPWFNALPNWGKLKLRLTAVAIVRAGARDKVSRNNHQIFKTISVLVGSSTQNKTKKTHSDDWLNECSEKLSPTRFCIRAVASRADKRRTRPGGPKSGNSERKERNKSNSAGYIIKPPASMFRSPRKMLREEYTRCCRK